MTFLWHLLREWIVHLSLPLICLLGIWLSWREHLKYCRERRNGRWWF